MRAFVVFFEINTGTHAFFVICLVVVHLEEAGLCVFILFECFPVMMVQTENLIKIFCLPSNTQQGRIAAPSPALVRD